MLAYTITLTLTFPDISKDNWEKSNFHIFNNSKQLQKRNTKVKVQATKGNIALDADGGKIIIYSLTDC